MTIQDMAAAPAGPMKFVPASGFHFESGEGVLKHVADAGGE